MGAPAGVVLGSDAPRLGASRRASRAPAGADDRRPRRRPGRHGLPRRAAPRARRPALSPPTSPRRCSTRHGAGRTSSASTTSSSQIEDAAALSFADASVDGILCRWGLMLVPDMEHRRRRDPRACCGPAVGPPWPSGRSPDDNDWITAPGRSALELGLMERPDPAAPGPFRLSADGRLDGLLTCGGLSVEHRRGRGRHSGGAGSLDEWWDVVRDTSRMLSMLLGRVGPDEAQAVREGAERRLDRWVRPDGSVAVPERRPRRARGATGLRVACREGEMARAGLEPATPRFSAVCSTS